MDTKAWGAVLLLVGGLVHLWPGLDEWLTTIAGGNQPWLQMVVGLASIIVAIALLSKTSSDTA